MYIPPELLDIVIQKMDYRSKAIFRTTNKLHRELVHHLDMPVSVKLMSTLKATALRTDARIQNVIQKDKQPDRLWQWTVGIRSNGLSCRIKYVNQDTNKYKAGYTASITVGGWRSYGGTSTAVSEVQGHGVNVQGALSALVTTIWKSSTPVMYLEQSSYIRDGETVIFHIGTHPDFKKDHSRKLVPITSIDEFIDAMTLSAKGFIFGSKFELLYLVETTPKCGRPRVARPRFKDEIGDLSKFLKPMSMLEKYAYSKYLS